MNRGKKILGILLIIVSVCALVAWEKWGKSRFLLEDVLVLEENAAQGTVITEDMLEIIKMDISESCLGPGDLDKVVGHETAFFVHKGAPLFPQYFVEEGLSAAVEKDRYILSIPESWIRSSPGTMARGNLAHFYCRGKHITSAPVTFVGEEGRYFEAVVSAKQAETLTKLVEGDGLLVITYN